MMHNWPNLANLDQKNDTLAISILLMGGSRIFRQGSKFAKQGSS